MIKRILSFAVSVMAAMAVNHVAADTVELAKAGTLKDAVATPASVTSLAVSGPMNAADFDFINRSMTNLVSIDLTGANIEAYSGSPVLTGYSSSPADVLPAYALHGMKLTSVALPASVATLGEGSLAGIAATTLSLPAVTTVGDGAFAGATKLASVSLASSDVTLGSLAFAGCSSLGSVTLAADRLPEGAFKNCTSLKSVTLSPTLESIGKDAFMGCSSLETFDFGASLADIGDGAFEGSGLTAADMSASTSLTSVGAWAFARCGALASVIMPESVQTVGQGAFFDDTSLTSVVLPDGLSTVEDYMMTGNTSLNSVTLIPARAETIGRYAYKGMSSMEHVTIPAGVSYIGDNAMEGMTSLSDIDANSLKTVPDLGQDVWKDVNQPEISLLVADADTGNLFKDADQWKEFKINIPSGAQDIEISDNDDMADVRVRFEGRVLVISASAGIKDAVVGVLNGVLIPATSMSGDRASFDTSGFGEDFYTVSVTTSDGRKGQFKLLRK